MFRKLNVVLLLVFLASGSMTVHAQKGSSSRLSDTTFAGLKLRNIGPALMSGRIADIAIHPDDENLWYVAVGSGGVWKTDNAGTTWKPVFDKQKVYSIGCVTIDPGNPHYHLGRNRRECRRAACQLWRRRLSQS